MAQTPTTIRVTIPRGRISDSQGTVFSDEAWHAYCDQLAEKATVVVVDQHAVTVDLPLACVGQSYHDPD